MSVRFRDATARDAPSLVEIYRPYVETTPVTFEVVVPSEAAFADRIRGISTCYPFLVAEDDDGVLGYTYACTHRERVAYQWTAEVSVYTASRARRRGVGRSLYERLFLLLERQGLVNAYAGISLPNDESVGFHEALGFERFCVYEKVGFKLGRWRDVGWWRRGLREASPAPEAPVWASELRGEPVWTELLAA